MYGLFTILTVHAYLVGHCCMSFPEWLWSRWRIGDCFTLMSEGGRSEQACFMGILSISFPVGIFLRIDKLYRV
jgi:hypothetical protein